VVSFTPTPKTTTSGWLDAETCSAACGSGITECRLTTFSVPPQVPWVDCTYLPFGHTEELNDTGRVPDDFDLANRLPGAALDLSTCKKACGPDATRCKLRATTPLGADEPFMLCRTSWEGGKCVGMHFPAGRVSPSAPPRAASSVGEYLAGCAELEAASIAAFALVDRELRYFGAPATLRRRARCARRDEARHARILSRLARELGARPRRRPRGSRGTRNEAPRSLAAFLKENAREGCVGETVGALLAWHQALHARDAELREAMARIARDEIRHAALAWAIHDRLVPELSASERDGVVEHLRASFDAYDCGLDVPPHVAREVGLPTRARLREMLEVIRGALRQDRG
jgi:hypothetical protein